MTRVNLDGPEHELCSETIARFRKTASESTALYVKVAEERDRLLKEVHKMRVSLERLADFGFPGISEGGCVCCIALAQCGPEFGEYTVKMAEVGEHLVACSVDFADVAVRGRSHVKNPHHKLDAKGHCKRCGLGSRHGTYCPVGFWADRKQHAAVDARIDEGKGFGDLEEQWLAEWKERT